MKKLLLPLFIVVCLVGDTSSRAITATTTTTTTIPQLGNISTRAFVQTGDNVMIGGFIIEGPQAKTVIVRAIGPELTQYGVPNALANPTLELHDGTGALIASNDNWQHTIIGGIITADQVADIQNGGHVPGDPMESAIVATLQPGNYTAIVRGVNNTTGVALVEVYELSPDSASNMGNISTRSFVQTGDNVMIGGFIIEGPDPKTVIVRAIGPELTQYGVPNALADPTLELHDGTGALIASNDNWQTTIIGGIITSDRLSTIQNSGKAPGDPSESAIIATLPPGNYTAIVRGVNGATGVALVEIYDLGSNSLAEITLAEVSETAFNSTGSTIRFRIAGETFSTNPDDVRVYDNEAPVPGELVHIGDAEITVDPILTEGRNDINLVALDSHGQFIDREFTLWAGNNTLSGSIVDENNQPVSGAELSLRLGDDQDIVSTTVSDNGAFTFTNLPGRTVLLDATASENRLASIAINGGDGFVQLKLDLINPPSPIDNNDFSLGTAGWDIGTAPVQIVPHQEGPTTPMDNFDLVLNTQGEGPQMISRTFITQPGTKNVTVRYRFITSEVPGGYFGSRYNDYFNISIRSNLGGGVISESQTMNGLGLAAFDANGATDWRETLLPVDVNGDIVQVNVTVANVADGLLDSQVVVDVVEEKQLSITGLVLNDIDATPLEHLSADSTNPYFGGKTRIYGQVTVRGASDDALQSLVLEVIQDGAVVATADLAESARGTLLRDFGPSGRVEITSTQLLFELTSAEAGNVDGTEDGTLSLRARATSRNGQEATFDVKKPVQLLVRYTGNNRYPPAPRDEDQGGDDWARPSLRDLVAHYTGISWNDFSNMNGGPFPPHGSHRDGIDVDGYFDHYQDRNAATAAQIVQHLNDAPYGSRIFKVFVAYKTTGSDSFWNAIKDVTLNDGRAAKNVIRPDPKHATHFHWRESTATPTGAIDIDPGSSPFRGRSVRSESRQ
jgi:hypothetical protein